jgi:hypothetical protein
VMRSFLPDRKPVFVLMKSLQKNLAELSHA